MKDKQLSPEHDSQAPKKKSFAGFLKKALIGVAACLAVLVFSVYLFVHFYFGRTFSNQLVGIVIRCSSGMQASYPGSEWAPLKAGRRIDNGTRIRTPGGTRSFMSFDGVRVLSDGFSEIEITGVRAFSLIEGSVDVESARRLTKPLEISLGPGVLMTDDSVVRIDANGGSFSAECVSGTAELSERQNGKHLLSAGQKATLTDGKVLIAKGGAQNAFAVSKTPVLDRIRERFNHVIAKYAYRFPANGGGARLGRFYQYQYEVPSWAEAGWQFASYAEGDFLNMAQAGMEKSMAAYYERLFVPSNRSISIGRQKVIALESGRKAVSFPRWSHDGSMIAYIEHYMYDWPGEVKVVRLDDLDHPWVISQEFDNILPMFPVAWAPDNRHVLFMVADVEKRGNGWDWPAPYRIKIAPINPGEGFVQDFDSPFYDIPLKLPLPIGKTISPQLRKLPWGDALLCANWGNIGYIPVEEDGQSVATSPGLFLTDFNPREVFVVGSAWSPSGSMIIFMAVRDLQVKPVNVYILYDVEDILDGFAPPPESLDDPRIKPIDPSENPQYAGGFSFDESLVFFQEDVSGVWRGEYPTDFTDTDFDLFYGNALPGEPTMATQIHLPGSQMFLRPSPEGNRIAYCDLKRSKNELKIVSFDIEADIDMDLGGVLIDNSGTNLIVPPGALEENFSVKISTPFDIGEEAEIPEGESHFFAMRLLDAKGLENPKFIEPMTLTIRYTDDEVEGLDEGMLEIYYYDESDPDNPVWVSLGGTVDPEYNEITVEIQHFSKFSIGGKELR